MTTDRICIGAILGAFGIKGEVRLKSFCADPAAIADYGNLTSEDGKQSFDLKITGPVKDGFSARIKGVQYRDQAEALKGTGLYTNRDALPNLPDDEFYHSDLIGLDVFDTGGVLLGKINAVAEYGAGDILDITLKSNGKSVMLPFTKATVPTVDLTTKRIVLDTSGGLLD